MERGGQRARAGFRSVCPLSFVVCSCCSCFVVYAPVFVGAPLRGFVAVPRPSWLWPAPPGTASGPCTIVRPPPNASSVTAPGSFRRSPRLRLSLTLQSPLESGPSRWGAPRGPMAGPPKTPGCGLDAPFPGWLTCSASWSTAAAGLWLWPRPMSSCYPSPAAAPTTPLQRRPATLLPVPYRLWARLQLPAVEGWRASWDPAVVDAPKGADGQAWGLAWDLVCSPLKKRAAGRRPSQRPRPRCGPRARSSSANLVVSSWWPRPLTVVRRGYPIAELEAWAGPRLAHATIQFGDSVLHVINVCSPCQTQAGALARPRLATA